MAILASELRPYRISNELGPLLIRKVDSIVPGEPGTGWRCTSVIVPPGQTGARICCTRLFISGVMMAARSGVTCERISASHELIEQSPDSGSDTGIVIGDGR